MDFLKCLDNIYEFYLSNKDENKVDNMLISCLLSLHEADLPKLNKIYIKNSNIQGLGVFALKNIKKGDIISLYPSELVIYHDNDKIYPIGTERVIKKYNLNKNMDDYMKNNVYIYNINENYSIVGDPYYIKDTNHVGHILNDGCNDDENYKLNSNCIYYRYKIFILIVANRDINMNEELLVSYLQNYWEMINK